MADDDWAARRTRMDTEQIQARGIADARVIAAMLEVPRHEFVPEEQRAAAHDVIYRVPAAEFEPYPLV